MTHCEEKGADATSPATPPMVVENEVVQERDWTDADERKIKMKLDLVLIVPLMLGFFALQLDKTNVSSAMTTDFTDDIGITNNIVNSGNQLQLAAIVAFEIPSNMVLSRVGAPTWLTFECFAWGMVALFQTFVHNKSSFYATRFLLGTFEAGYLAGSLVLLGIFYTKTETATRMTVLYTANYLAAGMSSIIAAGVFQLDGAAGLHDWQWLFLIDGLFTVLVALVLLVSLPRGPSHTRPLLGLPAGLNDLFTPRDRAILARRIALEDARRAVALESLGFRAVWRHLTSTSSGALLMWAHAALALVSLVPKGGLLLYAPTLIKDLGFGTTTANLLAAVPNFALILLALAAGRASDATRLRGPVCLACTAYALVMAGVQYSLADGGGGESDKWARYGVFVAFMAGNATFQGVNSAWLASNVRDPAALCVGQALVVMAANLGGLAGQQLFREEDAPAYTDGFLSIIGMYAGTLGVVWGLTGFYWWRNRCLVRSRCQANLEEEERYEI